MNYYRDRELAAAAALDAMLSRPSIPPDDMAYSDGECFNPWELFPCVYGSYSSEFDDMALAILGDLRDGAFNDRGLAGEMFREMMCVTGLCDYGTSPRVCFPTQLFSERLPRLIERWSEYAARKWGD